MSTNDDIIAAGQDVVAIYLDTTQLFADAKPIRMRCTPTKKPTQQPVESGGVRTDWAVINPVSLAMQVIIDSEEYIDVYQAIKASFLANDLLTVLTKADSFANMLIVSMPHEEDPEQFDVLSLEIALVEVIQFDATFQALDAAAASPADQSTVQRGEQQPQGSVAVGLFGKYIH